tara:strand:+ start:89 stop:448 length:360 start_codon:yes stop_codon:yes gene_type:complete
VRNDNDVLEGMLLGECVQVTLSTGQQLLDGVKACLAKPERPFAEGYTQDLLVKYTKVNGVEKYTPVSIPIERPGRSAISWSACRLYSYASDSTKTIESRAIENRVPMDSSSRYPVSSQC